MCGRYMLTVPGHTIAERFHLEVVPEIGPRYNIAPTQGVLCVRVSDNGTREGVNLHWGLIPFWAKDPSMGSRMINARSESVQEKPAFRAAFERRRCLVPADGFYEWQQTGGRKQPFCFRMRDGEPFGIAGLWERWQGPNGPLESCTILTTAANDIVRPVHDRMPVILIRDDYAEWLDPANRDREGLAGLLQPCDPSLLDAFPVSTRLGNPSAQGPELIAREGG